MLGTLKIVVTTPSHGAIDYIIDKVQEIVKNEKVVNCSIEKDLMVKE